MGAKNDKTITFTVGSVPTNPVNVQSTTSCGGSDIPVITFSWGDSANETGYWLDVSTDSGWTQWGYKTLSANTTTFAWSVSNQLSSGAVLTPAQNTTYYWRLKAFNASRESNHVYPVNSASPPGVSFATPNCNDIDGDGFSNAVENYLGTDPGKRCAATASLIAGQ